MSFYVGDKVKKIVICNDINQLKKVIDKVDGCIVGIDNMNVINGINIDINSINDIVSIIGNKELFISLNKNIFNNDLDNLKEILIELNNYNIAGVLYSDVCFINLKNELGLNYDLIWSQEHLTTNYETINYWCSFNVAGAYLSSDITISEIIDISKNTNTKLMVNIFGYLPMFVSKRHIVSNYLDYFNLCDNSNINYIYKSGNTYPIVDNNVGTTVYSSNILNGINEYYNLYNNGIDYIVLNGFNIDDDKFSKVIDIYNELNVDNILKCNKKINDMFKNIDSGFLYKETVSRVKRNEK